MITSKQIIAISEAYRDSFISPYKKGKLAVIYENPTSSEFRDMLLDKEISYKDVRFFIDNSTKKVFVWSSEIALHNDVAKRLGIFSRFIQEFPDNMIAGSANVQGGKAIFLSCDALLNMYKAVKSKKGTPDEVKYLTSLANIDWSWSYRYVDCSRFIILIKEAVKGK